MTIVTSPDIFLNAASMQKYTNKKIVNYLRQMKYLMYKCYSNSGKRKPKLFFKYHYCTANHLCFTQIKVWINIFNHRLLNLLISFNSVLFFYLNKENLYIRGVLTTWDKSYLCIKYSRKNTDEAQLRPKAKVKGEKSKNRWNRGLPVIQVQIKEESRREMKGMQRKDGGGLSVTKELWRENHKMKWTWRKWRFKNHHYIWFI